MTETDKFIRFLYQVSPLKNTTVILFSQIQLFSAAELSEEMKNKRKRENKHLKSESKYYRDVGNKSIFYLTR